MSWPSSEIRGAAVPSPERRTVTAESPICPDIPRTRFNTTESSTKAWSFYKRRLLQRASRDTSMKHSLENTPREGNQTQANLWANFSLNAAQRQGFGASIWSTTHTNAAWCLDLR